MSTVHPLAFEESENPWRPTEVVEELNGRFGLGVELVGLDDLVGGTSGAAYLRGLDGRELVLTRTKTDIGLMRLTAEATLGRHSPRSRRILDAFTGVDPDVVVAGDLVHTDYTLGNVLYDSDSQLSAVVDWNRGAARGDRRFALIGTQFCLQEEASLYGVEPAAIARLDEITRATIEPDLLQTFRAHWAAHNLHVSIENHFQAGRIEQDLQYAESIVSGPHYS